MTTCCWWQLWYWFVHGSERDADDEGSSGGHGGCGVVVAVGLVAVYYSYLVVMVV